VTTADPLLRQLLEQSRPHVVWPVQPYLWLPDAELTSAWVGNLPGLSRGGQDLGGHARVPFVVDGPGDVLEIAALTRQGRRRGRPREAQGDHRAIACEGRTLRRAWSGPVTERG
jgi:hypothetical protein